MNQTLQQKAAEGHNKVVKSRHRDESHEPSTSTHYIPSAKIIVSQSGDSPHMRKYNRKFNSATQIADHPVMIKAVSKKPITEEDGRIKEVDEDRSSREQLTRQQELGVNLNDELFQDFYFVKPSTRPMGYGPVDINPMDQSLNEKLA